MKPKVSILTPTFNRRPYFPALITCVANQDYPLSQIEWIIGDDGKDKIGDLVKDISYVRYLEFDKKLQLGEKRNKLMMEAKGDVIIHFDDDDYYPPDRISHAVSKLEESGKLMAFIPYIHIYFKHIKELRRVGPFPKYCAPEASFAYRKELLHLSSYADGDSIGEGISFLKKCNDSFVELAPRSTILCFSHDHNSVAKSYFADKKSDGTHKYENVKESDLEVEDYVKDKDLLDEYLHGIDKKLVDYPHATVGEKEDIKKLIDDAESNKKKIEEMKNSEGVVIPLGNGKGLLLKKDAIAQLVVEANTYKQKLALTKKELQVATNKMFDIKHERSTFEEADPNDVAVIVAVTQATKGDTMWDVKLLEHLFKSCIKGLDPDDKYTFYLCFDSTTEFGGDPTTHEVLAEIIKAQVKPLGLQVAIKQVYAKGAKYHDCWKLGFEKAREDGHEYFYFCDDLTAILTYGWSSDCVRKLKQNGDVGIVFLDSGTPRSHCAFMINIKHYNRLGYLFPDTVTNYAVEDWIKHTYSPNNTYGLVNHSWSRAEPDRRVSIVEEIKDAKEKEEKLTAAVKALEKEASHAAERSKPKALKPETQTSPDKK